jgi:hypothetical protein
MQIKRPIRNTASRSDKLQSAMEYLMTYGWAILIIAVVLGALFGLGFFNSSNNAPKVPPGSCQVYRPHGPGSTTNINLVGTCQNQLPQYAAAFNPSGSTSQNAVVQILSYQPNSLSQFSYFAWFDPTSTGGGQCCRRVMGTAAADSGVIEIALSPSDQLEVYGFGMGGWTPITSALSLNSWNFVGAAYNGVAYIVYLNGKQIWTNTQSISGATTGNFQIGFTTGEPPSGNQFFGDISNVQAYNASLTPAEITALYQEGIGGVPIQVQYLVGWWPLNGNANDYGGNQNNGVASNLVYTSAWTSSYSVP